MRYDFNKLERAAINLIGAGRDQDALRIYLYMSDGDSSLDAGYLGARIAECYERMGDKAAARYWYGRAVEENPEVHLNESEAYERLGEIRIDDLCAPEGP